ncbi:MAG TPA: DUF1761 domain-containing protein [Paracoccaceae bacterium]|nr:DUF1761 domain-containing protein [Paracoccaceae bacterium]
MELLNVIVAGIAGFAVGAVWYMSLAKPWMQATGIKMGPDGKPAGGSSPMPMIIGFVAMLVVAGMMRHIFQMAAIDTTGKGLIGGLGIGAFFITPWIAMNNAFGMRPLMLTVIDSGYAILGSAVIGLVLTLF